MTHPPTAKHLVFSIACGFLIASVAAIFFTWAIDPLVWSAVHFEFNADGDRWPAYDSWLGLEPPQFHVVLIVVFYLAFPAIAGGLAQRGRSKFVVPSLGWTAGMIALSFVASSCAIAYSWGMQFSWMWVLF